jgi:hypothetical protein
MKGWLAYAVIVVAIVLCVGWLFTIAFPGERERAAIQLSAIVVVVVQLGGFLALRLFDKRQMMVGWSATAVVRVLTVILYSVLVAKVFGMPIAPALLSMTTFFFLSTLVEPLLLRV